MEALDREVREDFIWVKKFEPYVDTFLMYNDSYTYLDTNQCLVEVVDPRSGKKVDEHKRIWLIVNKEQHHSLFQSLDHYADFQLQEREGKVSYGVWHDVLGKVWGIISNPKLESCVDKKTSSLQHMMAALLGFTKRVNVKTCLKAFHYGKGLSYNQPYAVICKTGCFKTDDAVWCGRVEQPTLHFDKSKPCPKMISLKCKHGISCESCGVERPLEVMEQEFEDKEVEVVVWMNAKQ